MKTADYPVWLAVMPDQRAAARADAGTHPDGGNAITWSPEDKLWYARPGADLTRLQAWLPDPGRRSGGGDPETEFLDALTDAGLIIDGLPVMDGEIHRVSVTDGPKGNGDGVYRGFLNGSKPGGWFINYWTAKTHKDITKWKATGGESDPVARLHMRAVARQARDDTARALAATHMRQTARAKALYDSLPPADPQHAYFMRKGVTADEGIRQTRNGALVVPLQNVAGEFRTLQYIPPDGDKFLFKEAPKAGSFRVVGGELRNGEPVLYAEGYATAKSLSMATGMPVVMTVDAGNMLNVADALRAGYPDSPHLFMADDDHHKPVNTGRVMAEQAARNIGGAVLMPALTAAERRAEMTDFNDVHHSRGIDALRADLRPRLNEALAGLNYKETVMATSDDAQPAPDNLPAVSPDALPDAAPARRPGAAKEKTADILKLRDDGLTPAQIAKELGIGQTSVYRILKAQQSEAAASSATTEPASADVTAGQPDKPGAMTHEPGAMVQDVPAPEVSLTNPVTLADVTSAEEPIVLAPAMAETAGIDIVPPAIAGPEPVPHAVVAEAPQPVTRSESTEAARALALSESGLSVARVAAELNVGMSETLRLIEAGRQQEPVVSSAAAASTESVMADTPSENIEKPEDDLRAEPDRRPVTSASPLTSAFGEENAILVGSPRLTPQDDNEPQETARNRVDLDKLISRITHEKHPDGKSVLFMLDGEPAFVDRANRLVMAEGASSHEEKVLAALLTAAEHYHGKIELTGSDEFKAFAIGLIVANDLKVSMKNASQQLALTEARRAAGQPVSPAAPADAVHGDQSPPRASDASFAEPAAQTPPSDVPVQAASPVMPSAPQHAAPAPVAAAPKISPAVHTPAEKAREPVTGKVTAFGQAPFRFEPGEGESTFITLRTKEGPQTFWGKELAGLLREANLKTGRMVTLQWQGKQPVTVKVPRKNAEGVVTHYENENAHRNRWSLSPAGGTRVQTGANDLVPLAAVDVNRYTQIQHTLVSRLGISIDAPPKPADGLYWLKPDGQACLERKRRASVRC